MSRHFPSYNELLFKCIKNFNSLLLELLIKYKWNFPYPKTYGIHSIYISSIYIVLSGRGVWYKTSVGCNELYITPPSIIYRLISTSGPLHIHRHHMSVQRFQNSECLVLTNNNLHMFLILNIYFTDIYTFVRINMYMIYRISGLFFRVSHNLRFEKNSYSNHYRISFSRIVLLW